MTTPTRAVVWRHNGVLCVTQAGERRQDVLDLGICVKSQYVILINTITARAFRLKFPRTRRSLSAIGLGTKMAKPAAAVLEQLHKIQRPFEIVGTNPQLLVKSPNSLTIQVHGKQLLSIRCLSDFVHGVQSFFRINDYELQGV